MGIQLNKEAYQKLIDENIEAIEKYMPEHLLEKKHTVEVLKWSINQIYPSGKAKSSDEKSGLHLACVSLQLQLVEKLENYIEFIGEELGELAVAASNRGWKSTRIEKGKELRKEIADLRLLLY